MKAHSRYQWVLRESPSPYLPAGNRPRENRGFAQVTQGEMADPEETGPRLRPMLLKSPKHRGAREGH